LGVKIIKLFKAEKLRAYRFCDNVWTFMMENVEFRDAQRPIEGSIDRVKFVACKLLESLCISGIYSKNPRFFGSVLKSVGKRGVNNTIKTNSI